MRTILNRSLSTMSAVDSIVWRKMNKAITLTLDRPKILNPLTTDICRSVVTKLLDWRKSSSNVNCFIVKGNGKAFCAGGDIKSLYQSLIATDATNIGTGKSGSVEGDFFRSEYEMNYLLGVSRIPQVSILNGIVMGGGVGLSYFGEFRIATENSLWAMPECAIGIFPDVGSCSWLPKLNSFTDKNKRINVPGLGLYLALTGQRLYAADLINVGIATHFIHSSKLEALEDVIIENVNNNDKNDTSEIISEILKSFSGEGSIGPDDEGETCLFLVFVLLLLYIDNYMHKINIYMYI
jgi:3-hydroxyisobutyryl-CoA hydrolase